MVGEGLQNYVSMVSGLTKTTKAKAAATAKAFLAQAGLEEVATDAQERVTKLAEEILNASKANRELLQNLVEAEVGKTAARLGFVRSEELDVLRRELTELRLAMAHQAAHSAPEADIPVMPFATSSVSSRPVRPPAATKTAAKRAPSKKVATAAPAKAAASDPSPTEVLATEDLATEDLASAIPARMIPARAATARKVPARKVPTRIPATGVSATTRANAPAPRKRAVTKTPVDQAPAATPPAVTTDPATPTVPSDPIPPPVSGEQTS